MNTFLILINLANPVKAQDAADYYRTVPDLAGWKGHICIKETCEEIDRTDERIVLKPVMKIAPKEGTTPAVEVQPDGSSTHPIEIKPDPIDKIMSGLNKIFDGASIEADVEVTYKSKKNANGSEELEVTVKVGGKASQ